MTRDGIGAAVRRKEDYRFLTGKGTYVDDMNRPGQAYASIVRSPHAHARIKSINTAEVKKAPGFCAVFTGADMRSDDVGGLPCGWLIHNKDGSPMKEPPYPVLSCDKVRHVGEPLAVVIAETRNQARDAAEALEVEYEELPAVVSTAEADRPDAPQIYEEAPNNVCFDWEIGDRAEVEEAFANAHHVTKLDLINNRLVPNAMEPRAAIGEYDPAVDRYTLYTTSQNPHVIRVLMSKFVLKVSESKLRVVAPDVGGGFGSKIYHYAEEAIVTWVAKKIGRPVKWTAERSESFVSDAQGRDHVTHAELALDQNGTFLALRVSTIANLGGHLSTFGTCIPTYLYATLLAGLYTTPAIYCEVKGVFTNTVPVDAYRGAGRPEACYVVERLAEAAAREMGFDKVKIRRRHFISKEAKPYQTPVILQYDTGDFVTQLDDALKHVHYEGFEARSAAARAQGKLVGIGLSTYIEACGLAPSKLVGELGLRAGLYESAELRFHPDGSVTVFTGSHTHGQGHETTFAQLVEDRLGIPIDKIDVVHGDTDKGPFGMGTYGSRSTAIGGSAIVRAADKVISKGKKIAAHMLEVAEADVEFEDGTFFVSETNKSINITDVASSAYMAHNYPLDELEPGLDETAFYDPKNFTFPNGCHVCEVEIDEETGEIKITRFVAIDDFGTIINPMIVQGQVHGGLVQGIGQALFENCIYDEEAGQLYTGSYMDYCMPKADHMPSFEVTTNEHVPCTHNPLGVKGCGEAGAIGAPPAVMNAILDALSPLGVTHMDMPATSEKIWRAIRDAKIAQAAG
jgi:carbon-monoxide dehydrogenase large subunit